MNEIPFDHQSKATWIKQVNAELKDGFTYHSLIHNLETGLSIEPFYHPDDHVERSGGYGLKPNNDWHIMLPGSLATLDPDLKTALEYDVKFLKLKVQSIPELALTASSMLKFPNLRFHLLLTDTALINAVPDSHQIAGVRLVQYDRDLRKYLLDWNAKRHYPTSIIYVENHKEASATNQLSQILNDLVEWFELAKQADVSRGVIINLTLGSGYLSEIAKLRALKLLLFNFWQAYDLGSELSYNIEGKIKDSNAGDPEVSLIKLTSRSVSAVVGGVDFLCLYPPESTTENHHHTTVLSLQHIMKLEGFLDKVIDPAAGSYQLEKMTNLIANKSWLSFQKKRGGQGASGSNK